MRLIFDRNAFRSFGGLIFLQQFFQIDFGFHDVFGLLGTADLTLDNQFAGEIQLSSTAAIRMDEKSGRVKNPVISKAAISPTYTGRMNRVGSEKMTG